MKYEIDKQYKVVSANEDFCEIYGISVGDIVTCHYVDSSGYLYTRDVTYRNMIVNMFHDHGAWCFASPDDKEVNLELVDDDKEVNLELVDDEKEPSLSTIFRTSLDLGLLYSNPKREYDYVMSKCMEELGELSVEVQIENGLSYKDPGKDGIAGESVDLAITAMDMFALSCGDMEPEEIEKRFLAVMEKKIKKWKEKA